MFWLKRLKPDDPQKREVLKSEIEKQGGLEKHDMLAMVISALIVLVPVCLVLLVAICFLAGLPVWFS